MDKSEFAPAGKASWEKLNSQIRMFKSNRQDDEFGNALPVIFLIHNKERQIVYANKRVLEALDLEDYNCVYGKRIGELFNCENLQNSPEGCGTSEFCRNCGAIQAILGAQAGRQTVKECRLTSDRGLSKDFKVMATPIEREGEQYTLFTLEDIQHEKRRQALEKTFFHDLLNTAGGVVGLTEVLQYVDCETKKEEILGLLQTSSRRLVEEIVAGRALSEAEQGKLRLQYTKQDATALVLDTINFYRNHGLCNNRTIHVGGLDCPVEFVTDKLLYQRIISNLIKNALEAIAPGQSVLLSLREDDHSVVLSVHNEGVMPREVKQQVFQRSFSTKGEGRGIGTYSIRLFTESYLKGKVWFESEEDSGTIFHVRHPKFP